MSVSFSIRYCRVEEREMLHDVPDPFDLDYHGPRVIYRFVMALFDTRRDRNLDRGYSRSLPTPTFRHSRTRHKSRS